MCVLFECGCAPYSPAGGGCLLLHEIDCGRVGVLLRGGIVVCDLPQVQPTFAQCLRDTVQQLGPLQGLHSHTNNPYYLNRTDTTLVFVLGELFYNNKHTTRYFEPNRHPHADFIVYKKCNKKETRKMLVTICLLNIFDKQMFYAGKFPFENNFLASNWRIGHLKE